MSDKVDLNKYMDFVEEVTSSDSNDFGKFMNRLGHISVESQMEVNPSLLLTGAVGISSEAGEFAEIVKKMLFQGKECTDDTILHMMKELGDIAWYWINACRAIGADPNEVISMNVDKLKARYPGGEFNVLNSENRADGDI